MLREDVFSGSLFGLEVSILCNLVEADPEHHPWRHVDVIQPASIPSGSFSFNYRV